MPFKPFKPFKPLHEIWKITKCNHKEHNPPNMIVLPVGLHMWVCPACGHTQLIIVPDSRLLVKSRLMKKTWRKKCEFVVLPQNKEFKNVS